jgi:glycosyltransferase involved in cell wall biosynthesis
MAAAIARVLDDDALAADLVARGRARAGGFSWDAAADGVLAALRAAATAG